MNAPVNAVWASCVLKLMNMCNCRYHDPATWVKNNADSEGQMRNKENWGQDIIRSKHHLGPESEASVEMPKTCILSNDQQGANQLWLYRSLWENDPTHQMNDHPRKHLPDEVIASRTSFKCYWIKHDDNFVNDGTGRDALASI